MITKIDKNKIRLKRHSRMRFHLNGTAERPRLNVFRSNTNIYAQIIDDEKGTTLVSASTLDKDFNRQGTKTEQAKVVGEILGKRALDKNIKQVIFDRGGYVYHGRVMALADGAREAGLDF
jgi:large subunit ribosomal protein L18